MRYIPYRILVFLALIYSLCIVGCGSSDSDMTDRGSAKVDTLASGEIAIQNAGASLWESEEGWEVLEEMRYGSGIGEDTVLFGQVGSFDVDEQGHLYVLDRQSQEIHIFDLGGALIRTVGGKGGGPGEFESAVSVDVSYTGEIWVVEMADGKLTVLDSEGNYQRTWQLDTIGRFYTVYPGGFDRMGHYNALIFSQEGEDIEELLVRFDEGTTPIDTIAVPKSPVEAEFFELVSDDGRARTTLTIPNQGSFDWTFAPGGNLWTLYTGTYELTEMTTDGKVIRRANKDFEPIRVTSAELEQFRQRVSWFTDQGGTVDMSRIPRQKPVVESFFSDEEGNLWVLRTGTSPEDANRLFDIFNAEGYFLGEIRLPFSLIVALKPVVQGGILYGMTRDESGTTMIVSAQIHRN